MQVEVRLLETLKNHELMRSSGQPSDLTGTVRVDAHTLGHLKLEAKLGRFTITSDEPEERGGTDIGPGPLAYFVAAGALCLMMQYVKMVILERLPVDSVEMTVRAHFDRRVGGSFQDMIYEIRITGDELPDKVRELSHRAEERCYIHNTLKKAVRMKSTVMLNGNQVAEIEHNASLASAVSQV
jgi:uncharacterized OsmC-like protein